MKIRRISDFQCEIQFPIFQENYKAYFQTFLSSDLGKIYTAIPWRELVRGFGLVESKKGPQSIFSPRGKIALMFLKHYAGCSDRKLMEQLNANIHYQIFCDIVLTPEQQIGNYKLVSEIRCELASRLDMKQIQTIFALHWNGYCSNKESITCDATCYESYMRYPTDVKLLYEGVIWNYKQLKKVSRQYGAKMIRTKRSKWVRRYQSYSKSKRPSRKQTRSMIRGLLKLLTKINERLLAIEGAKAYKLVPKYWERRQATRQILSQQTNKFYKGIKPKGRIVSLDKPYIRPIVRGKEIKKVEFGAKVHKFQVDGISYIEHLDFEAFNEGVRFKETIYEAQRLTHTQVKLAGADGIYANNTNRKHVTEEKIKTDFKRKGRPSKHKDHFAQLAKMITKERASRLEGSFGTDKEHFLLNRVKARTEQTERLWIFFGIHTSNALKIGRRMAAQKAKAA